MFKRHSYKAPLDSKKVSTIFLNLGKKKKEEKTKVSELLTEFNENGLLLMMLFFALPVAIPLPYPPGFTTIMGTPLIILSIQMLCGFKQVFLPEKINKYEINNSMLISISNKAVPILKSFEKYIKPRFTFAQSIYCEQFVGLISLLCAISVAIPLPLTNAAPALGIVVMSLGLLNRDGLVILFGVVISIIGLLVAFLAVAAGLVSIKYLFNLFF